MEIKGRDYVTCKKTIEGSRKKEPNFICGKEYYVGGIDIEDNYIHIHSEHYKVGESFYFNDPYIPASQYHTFRRKFSDYFKTIKDERKEKLLKIKGELD